MTFPRIMAVIMFFVLAANLLMVMHHWTLLDDPDEMHLVHHRCIIIHAVGAVCSAVAMILWMAM